MLILANVLAENGGSLPNWTPWITMGAIVLIFYFLLIAPQRRKEKRRRAMLGELQKKDSVITIGGIHGIVKQLTDRDVTILVDEKRELTLKVNRSAIYTILDREEGELSREERDRSEGKD